MTALLAPALIAPIAARAQSEQLRDTWQRVPDLFAAAGVRPGARIVDLGAGDGFLTVRLSPAIGSGGRIYAIDVDAKVADQLRNRVAQARLMNVDVVIATAGDPHLPPTVDGVIILNAYHEMSQWPMVLNHIFQALTPGGRLVICEPAPRTSDQPRATQVADHTIDPNLVADEVRGAGFQMIDSQVDFATNLGGTHFSLVVAERPRSKSRDR